MARRPRSYSPGGIFHLTARTQGHRPWFQPRIRSRIVQYMVDALAVSDAWLLAYAVMPTHLHLVVRQGHWPLGRVMQPLLQRTAILVQRTSRLEGHVFERRFTDHACRTPTHARNAVVYTNLNPVRAGLVEKPSEYPWTSHTLYATGQSDVAPVPDVVLQAALSLFDCNPDAAPAQLCDAYNRFVEWRLQLDRQDQEDVVNSLEDPPAMSNSGPCWSSQFPLLFEAPPPARPGATESLRPSRPDLDDIALATLAQFAPGFPLERVRSREKTRVVVRLRRAMVERMSAAGYRGQAIARYLCVSPQCVSNILASTRSGRTRSA